MTTSTAPRKSTATYVAAYGGGPGQIQARVPVTEVDLDTRLAMASAGMDALLKFKHGAALVGAQAAVRRIESEAELLGLDPTGFRPNRTLKAAGDLIRKRGWTKGVYSSGDGALCAMGAIREAVYGPRWMQQELGYPAERSAVEELLNRIAIEVGNCYSVPKWNDTRANQDEVLRLLY